jgi:N-glycosylase/DNA lyase
MPQIVRDPAPHSRDVRGEIVADQFDLGVSMDCGQVFGWDRDEGIYTGIVGQRAVRLWQEGGSICFAAERGLNTSQIREYLGLDEDLASILRSINRDTFMEKVVAEVKGLRLLKQDPWVCLCSYILSANNRVERIDKLVKEISRRFGKRHVVGGTVIHSLPDPECDLAVPAFVLGTCSSLQRWWPGGKLI